MGVRWGSSMKRHRLRHGDRVAYAAGPNKRKLELVKNRPSEHPSRVWFHYDLGTVVIDDQNSASVIWDDAEVNVDDVVASTGLLWEEGRIFNGDGCAYAIVTSESRRTTAAQRRWRAAAARRRLDKFCREN